MGNQKKITTTIRLEKNQAEDLAKISKHSGITQSNLIRRGIALAIAEANKRTDALKAAGL